jgi:hypothetical protein
MQEAVDPMKRPVILLSAALLVGAMAAPGFAQDNPNTRYGQHHPYVERFDNFLDSHPDVNQALSKNPRLIDDPQFIANHPGLHEYLEKHPRVREAFRDHPDRFMHRERRYEVSENRWERRHDRDHDHDRDAH